MSLLPESKRSKPASETSPLLDAAATPQAEGGQKRAAPNFQLQSGAKSPSKGGDKQRGQGLPKEMVEGFLTTTGVDLSGVQVFYDSPKPKDVKAHAVADPTGIHLAEGQEGFLYEEAAHKVQQLQGKVRPNTAVNGTPVNDDAAMEDEAVRMGEAAKAVTAKAATPTPPPVAAAPTTAAPAASQVTQRAANPTAQDYKDHAALSAMTLGALDKYAQAQADWHVSSLLSDAERDEIRNILAFAREPEMLGPCYGFKVSELQTEISLSGSMVTFGMLRHYAQAVKQKPFRISATADAAEAVQSGLMLETLKGAFPDWVLSYAMQEDQFESMKYNNYGLEAADYYKNAPLQPFFQAENGMDFTSFYRMRLLDSANPLTYANGPLKGFVRNIHRFESAALDALEANVADTSKTKPLTLILHSAIDHNGAFHRETGFTNLVQDANSNAIMIEGKETLADVQTEIPKIAKKYGKNDVIDQVMIAGHGNAQSIQLGGKVEEDVATHQVKEVSDGINVSDVPDAKINPRNMTSTEALFNEIFDNMDKEKRNFFGIKKDNPNRQVHRRILFNACLTGSNNMSALDLSGKDEKAARKAIKKWLKENRNLVDWTTEAAKNAKNDDVQGVGSVASFGRADYLNASGGLDIISAIDPKVTASKLVYLEEGIEPLGALRAVLESWALDEAGTKAAMQRRVAKPATSWGTATIKGLFEIILNSYWNNAHAIKVFGYVASKFSHGASEAHCRVDNFKDMADNNIYESLWKAVQGTPEWNNRDYVPLVMYQTWMTLNAAAGADAGFLTQLETKFDCQTASKYIDFNYLITKGHFAKLLGGAASKGKLMLALMAIQNDPTQADAKAYLIAQLDAKDQFPAALDVHTLLGGTATEDEILMQIGKLAPPPSVAAPVVAPVVAPAVAPVVAPVAAPVGPDANMSTKGDKQNTARVQSVTKSGLISVPVAKAYKEAEKTTELGDLTFGDKVNIFGSTADCWAIEYNYDATTRGSAFVAKTDIKVS